MDEVIKQVSQLLHDAGETHHIVYKIVDGNDDDWASWYSQWLLNLSHLSELLGIKLVRSELTYLFVKLDKEYGEAKTQERWEDWYAKRLVQYFK